MSKIIYYSDDCEEFCQQLDFFEYKFEEQKDDKDCGKKVCKNYTPKNGLRGKCIHKSFSLTGTGKKFILNENGLMEVCHQMV